MNQVRATLLDLAIVAAPFCQRRGSRAALSAAIVRALRQLDHVGTMDQSMAVANLHDAVYAAAAARVPGLEILRVVGDAEERAVLDGVTSGGSDA